HKIEVPRFNAISKEVKEYDVEVPGAYEDGMDIAIRTLADIQRYRDVLISLKIAMIDKRNRLSKLWHTARASLMLRDPGIDKMETVVKKEAAIKLTFTSLFDKKQLASDNVECLVDLVDNAIAKFNTVSRQVALMEMQVRLGEVESKRKR
ncbi:unnamed protein product, partial [marine sediment metagenome]